MSHKIIIDCLNKLSAGDSITQDEIREVLKAYEYLEIGMAHLASCQAATLESLPKSTSKRERERHQSICLSAADILKGDITSIRYKTKKEAAIDRCLQAVQAARDDQARVLK